MKFKYPEFHWHDVRNWGAIRYFQFSYVVLVIVPLLAAVYEMNPELPYLGPVLGKMPLNLKLVYLASLFYAVGTAIYQFWCPYVVKNYPTKTEYIRENLDMLARSMRGQMREVIEKYWRTNDSIGFRKESSPYLHSSKEHALRELEMNPSLAEKHYLASVQRSMSEYYYSCDSSRPIAIFISLASYILGSVILLYLLVVKAAEVFTA